MERSGWMVVCSVLGALQQAYYKIQSEVEKGCGMTVCSMLGA